MNKQVNTWLAAGVAAASLLAPSSAHAAGGINVSLEGTPLQLPSAPFEQNDRTYVPMRAIFEQLGAVVSWDAATNTVTGIKGDVIVSLTIGSKNALRNDAPVVLDAEPLLVGGSTYVPVRFIAESFNNPVSWNGATQTVHIGKSNRAELNELMRSATIVPPAFHQMATSTMTIHSGSESVTGTVSTHLERGVSADKTPEIELRADFAGPLYDSVKSFEMFGKGDNIYARYEGDTAWSFYKTTNAPELYEHLNKPYPFKMPESYNRFATLSEEADGYHVRYRFDGSSYKNLLKAVQADDVILKQLEELTSAEIHQVIDKQSRQLVRYESTLEAMMAGYPTTIEVKATMEALDSFVVELPNQAESATPYVPAEIGHDHTH